MSPAKSNLFRFFSLTETPSSFLFFGRKRIAPLSRLRQQYRPVILLGDEAYLKKCIKGASAYKESLQSKGVLLIPLQDTQSLSFKRTSTLGESKGFDQSGSREEAEEAIREEQRWVVQPREPKDWLEVMDTQKRDSQALQYSETMYLQVQLDGTVRAQGPGQPNWKDLLTLPDRESFRSKVTG